MQNVNEIKISNTFLIKIVWSTLIPWINFTFFHSNVIKFSLKVPATARSLFATLTNILLRILKYSEK